MGLEYRESPSGLVLALEGQDEAAIAAALRNYDAALRLVPQAIDSQGRTVYKVFRRISAEQTAFVCGWWDENGDALPLSSGLLEKVRELDLNTRGGPADPDDLNERLLAARRREHDYVLDEIVREHGPRIEGKKSSPLPRGMSLLRARDRVRAATKTREFKP